MKKRNIFITTMILVFLDQSIKILINSYIKLGETKTLLGQAFKLHYVINKGGAFSIGNNKISAIIVLNSFLVGVLIYFLLKDLNRFNKSVVISITLILGGGIGNLIDRIFRGFVIDYLDVSYLFKFPIFNLADIFIVMGVIFIIITLIFERPKGQEIL